MLVFMSLKRRKVTLRYFDGTAILNPFIILS